MTKTEKANQILLWIYEEIGEDEFADIPPISKNNYPRLGMEFNEFCELLIKLRDKGLISMNSEDEKSIYLPVFSKISFENIGIERCRSLNENNMIKFNLPKSNVSLTSNPNVRINSPFNTQKPSANKKDTNNENENLNTNSFSKSEIQEFIKNDKTEEALKVLQELTKDKSEANEVILIYNQFNSSKKKVRSGIISEEQASLQMNKINAAILDLLGNI